MKLTKEKKEEALKLFQVPEEFYKEALKMLSAQELELILLMKDRTIRAEELMDEIREAGITSHPEVLVQNAYSRAVLRKYREDGDKLCYRVSDLYDRYPYFAQYEYEEYARFPREVKDRLNQWDFDVYYGVYGNDVKAKMESKNQYVHNSDYLTLQEAYAFVDKHQELVYRVPCNCKCMMDVTDKPRNVCINFDNGDNTQWDRGHGERLTPERAKELMKEWNSRGLMQNREDFAICNCDGASCYPLQMARKAGSQGVYPRSRYQILWDSDTCVNCGKCTRICNFHAFTMGEDKKVSFHRELCWGCTICSENCPKGAITLCEKED